MPEPIGSAPNDAAKRPGSIGLKPSDACCQTLEARPIQALRGCAGETVPGIASCYERRAAARRDRAVLDVSME